MNNLQAIFDARRSFYGKAKVEDIYNDDSVLVLYSYDTKVAQITKNKNNIKYHYFGQYSQTTTRHQKEFFRQAGLSDKEIKELFKNEILEKVYKYENK